MLAADNQGRDGGLLGGSKPQPASSLSARELIRELAADLKGEVDAVTENFLIDLPSQQVAKALAKQLDQFFRDTDPSILPSMQAAVKKRVVKLRNSTRAATLAMTVYSRKKEHKIKRLAEFHEALIALQTELDGVSKL
ncbi:hypothetical protein ACWEPL_38815 [Nonomuraea sp. NPDC004186]